MGLTAFFGVRDDSMNVIQLFLDENPLFTKLCAIGFVAATDNLVYVTAIWRHGDRAPGDLPYPKDVYDESYWPHGWEELSNLGMLQMHDLGAYFKQEYQGTFVNTTYNYKEIYVRSSDSDRALVSAQAFMNGFYPPVGTDVWQTGLDWQPIAIHATTPGEADPPNLITLLFGSKLIMYCNIMDILS
uniref:DUF4470 domain-containing protein n=1 Tax=Panagrellus redivivus TaxID=6233 RepID=A0A7E4VDB4_PANRE